MPLVALTDNTVVRIKIFLVPVSIWSVVVAKTSDLTKMIVLAKTAVYESNAKSDGYSDKYQQY
jgi:hypothetical protein